MKLTMKNMMLALFTMILAGQATYLNAGEPAVQLTWIGHASFKITTDAGKVIYIDPYAGKKTDYADPADLVLVTHGHGDHSNVSLVTRKSTCQIFSGSSANVGGTKMAAGDSAEAQGVKIYAVEAYNKNHPKGSGVGFVVDINGKKIYHSGDTENIPEMKDLASFKLDIALLCIDGRFTMGPEQAAKAAEIIQAKKNIPMHAGFDPEGIKKNISEFNPPGKTVMQLGKPIDL